MLTDVIATTVGIAAFATSETLPVCAETLCAASAVPFSEESVPSEAASSDDALTASCAVSICGSASAVVVPIY